MRIAFVSRYPPVHCGIGEYTRMLVHAMTSIDPGLEIIVFSSSDAGWDEYVDKHVGVKVVPSFERGEQSYSKLAEAIRANGDFDVLHVQHEYSIFGLNNGILRTLVGLREEGVAKRIVMTLHTVYHSSYEGSRVLQPYLDALDAVVVHSVLQEMELIAQGVDPRRIWRIPHGTLINKFLGYPRRLIASMLDIDESRLQGIVLATMGFLERDKGIDLLVEAARRMDRNTTLLVAGEPTEPDVLEDLEDLENAIVLPRYLDHDTMLAIAALADILVLPYRDKPWVYGVSGVLHLSMGSLKPIIGTRIPKLVELYQYAPRLTVPPEDPNHLALRIKWVVENYDMVVAYSSQLFSYAARTQWPRMARRHLELYKLLLSRDEPDWQPLWEPMPPH
ncbi:MAG: glycosyltransferase [Pyrodictiaceae archaeon]